MRTEHGRKRTERSDQRITDLLLAARDRKDWEAFTERCAPADAAFQSRCRQTAAVTHSLVRLRAARRRWGFQALPFFVFVDKLAKAAGIAIDPVLTWFGLSKRLQPSTGNADAFVRLGVALGLNLNEILILVHRCTVDDMLFPVILTRRREGGYGLGRLGDRRAINGARSAGILRIDDEVRAAFARYHQAGLYPIPGREMIAV
jgi:hypothetical protein